MPEVYISTADFRPYRAEQRSPRGKIRTVELADLDRTPRPWHDGGKDAITHGVRYP